MNMITNMEDERVLLSEDKNGIRNARSYAQPHARLLNAVYQLLIKVKEGIEFSLDDIFKMTENDYRFIEDFIRSKIADCVKDATIGGMTVDRSKLKELIQVPDLSEVHKAMGELKAFHTSYRAHSATNYNWGSIIKNRSMYKLESGQIIIDEVKFEKWCDGFRIYVEPAVHDSVTKIINELNSIVEHYPSSRSLTIVFNANKNKYEIDTHGFK